MKQSSGNRLGRLIIVFEPRSNSLKLGAGKQDLVNCFNEADIVHVFDGSISWDARMVLCELGEKVHVDSDLLNILRRLLSQAKEGDTIVFMSNGDFHGILPSFIEMLNDKKRDNKTL